MKTLVLLGFLVAGVAFFLPREVREVVLADGDRGVVDETVVVRLKRFSVPAYPSGRPRQYVSEIRWSGDGGDSWDDFDVSVNHPLRVNGWWIYQMNWSQDASGRLVTQLSCVREPWFPLALSGWVLAVLGAAGLCRSFRLQVPPVRGGRLRRGLSWTCALTTVALPVFIIGRAVLRPEPVPALQSWMMAPHVAAYAASYLLLLFAAFGIGRRFMAVGFLLMTVGLVLGAWWGKMAWGSWWQNDPKELWSLATWLVYAGYFHVCRHPKAEAALRISGAVLIVLTLTWVNFSRIFVGLHSYA